MAKKTKAKAGSEQRERHRVGLHGEKRPYSSVVLPFE